MGVVKVACAACQAVFPIDETWGLRPGVRVCVPCLRAREEPTAPVPLIERHHTNVYVAPKALTILTVGQPCRFCRCEAFTADDTGPLHACCEMWAAEPAKGKPCPACAESRRQAREWAQRQAIQGKQRRKGRK